MCQKTRSFLFGCSLMVLSGCASTTHNLADPWEDFNREIQTFNDRVDDMLMEPVSESYLEIVPPLLNQVISNIFSNVDDVGISMNTLLQGKFLQAGQSWSRVVINSSLGFAGVFDVASELHPYLGKKNEDFGQTLGVWGVPTGPYLVVPFLGPSSLRGFAGVMGDIAMDPTTYVGGYISAGLGMLNAIDTRANMLTFERIASEAALDRYQFFRDGYIRQRQYLLFDGNIPASERQDDFDIDKALDDL